MALETLCGLRSIGEFSIEEVYCECPRKGFIEVNHNDNSISFQIQNGPIKEVGVNGCQVDTLIETAKVIISRLNSNFPCRENSLAITKLEEALHWLEHRRKDRETRGVEGFSKE